MTFADYYIDAHTPKNCFYNFTCWSVERRPTEEEKKEEPNVFLRIENQLFFYRPFVMEDIEIGKGIRL